MLHKYREITLEENRVVALIVMTIIARNLSIFRAQTPLKNGEYKNQE